MKHDDQFRKYVLLLSCLLVGGFLSYSVIFLTISGTINPVESLRVEITQDMFYWRQMGENIVAACSVLYCLGHIIMACYGIKKRFTPRICKCILYFVVQVALMLACTVPFACLDPLFFGGYVFPICGTAGALAVIIVASFCVSFYRAKKQKIC